MKALNHIIPPKRILKFLVDHFLTPCIFRKPRVYCVGNAKHSRIMVVIVNKQSKVQQPPEFAKVLLLQGARTVFLTSKYKVYV